MVSKKQTEISEKLVSYSLLVTGWFTNTEDASFNRKLGTGNR